MVEAVEPYFIWSSKIMNVIPSCIIAKCKGQTSTYKLKIIYDSNNWKTTTFFPQKWANFSKFCQLTFFPLGYFFQCLIYYLLVFSLHTHKFWRNYNNCEPPKGTLSERRVPAVGELIGRVKICTAIKLRFEKKKSLFAFGSKPQDQYWHKFYENSTFLLN